MRSDGRSAARGKFLLRFFLFSRSDKAYDRNAYKYSARDTREIDKNIFRTAAPTVDERLMIFVGNGDESAYARRIHRCAKNVTGFRSQFGKIFGDNSDCYFCEVERGMGINEQSRFEGMRMKNFIGTQILGPILPLNPEFCEYILRLAGEKDPVAAHREAAVAAFDRRVREFSDPKVKF